MSTFNRSLLPKRSAAAKSKPNWFIRLLTEPDWTRTSFSFLAFKLSEIDCKHIEANLNTIQEQTRVHPALYEAMFDELFKSISNINKS